MDFSINSFLGRVALRSDLHRTEGSVEKERDCFLEKLNHCITGNEQFKKMILEMNAAIKAMSRSLVDMQTKDATVKTETEFLLNSNAALLASAV